MKDFRDLSPQTTHKLGSKPTNVIPELESFFHPEHHRVEDGFLVCQRSLTFFPSIVKSFFIYLSLF